MNFASRAVARSYGFLIEEEVTVRRSVRLRLVPQIGRHSVIPRISFTCTIPVTLGCKGRAATEGFVGTINGLFTDDYMETASVDSRRSRGEPNNGGAFSRDETRQASLAHQGRVHRKPLRVLPEPKCGVP
jgi:hypothetical protein